MSIDRDTIIDRLRRLRPALVPRGVAHLGLFGSLARGEGRAGSDIDVVVTPVARLTLFDMGFIQATIGEAFPDRSVDVVIEPIKRSALREAIEIVLMSSERVLGQPAI